MLFPVFILLDVFYDNIESTVSPLVYKINFVQLLTVSTKWSMHHLLCIGARCNEMAKYMHVYMCMHASYLIII